MPPATSGQFAEHFQITIEQVEQCKVKKELTWPLQGETDQDIEGWLRHSRGSIQSETP
jgi:hypothetical protein